MSLLALITGYAAGIAAILMAVPQARKIWRTQDDRGVNVTSWVLSFIAVSAWTGYGVRTNNIAIVTSNVGMCFTVGAVLVAMARTRQRRLTIDIIAITLIWIVALSTAVVLPIAILTTYFIASSMVTWLQTVTSWRTWRSGGVSNVSIGTLFLRLAVNSLWLLHGIVLSDVTIMMPVIVGIIGTLTTLSFELAIARRQRAVALAVT